MTSSSHSNMKSPSKIQGDEADDVDELALNSEFCSPPRQPVVTSSRRRRASTTPSAASATKRVKPTPVKPTPVKPKAAKKTKDDIYNDPDRILGPTKSPLYKQGLNLLEVLYHPKAQASLAASPQGYLIAALSPEELSRAVAAFKDDGLSGKHDPIWLADAHAAHAERHAGRFDDLLDHKFQEQWGESNEEITDSESDEASNDPSRNRHEVPVRTSSNGYNEQIKDDDGDPERSLTTDERENLTDFHQNSFEHVNADDAPDFGSRGKSHNCAVTARPNTEDSAPLR